jgi:peptidoglycan hydrolase-like protein with peptidoglycan-binding domain
MIMHRWMILTLLVGGLTGNALTEAASSPPSPTVAIVAIQVQLRALGYDPGPIDGRGGRRTIAALTAYAKDRRIVLNQATMGTVVARLRAEAYVMLLDVEATEESGDSGPQGDLQVIPIGRW